MGPSGEPRYCRAETSRTSGQREFARGLRLFDSTMIVVGSMIGSGIFIVSADVARTVGSAGLLLAVWVVTGAVTIAAALSYGELAAMMPAAGGQYVYLREAYNPLVAFLYGWTLFLVIQTGTIAAVAVAFAKFTAVIVPWFGEHHAALRVGRLSVSWAQVLAIASIAVLTFINLQGLRQGKIVQNLFTFTKVAALVGLIACGIFIGKNEAAVSANFSDLWKGTWTHVARGGAGSVDPLSGIMVLAAIGVAMVGSLFSSDAWNNITFTAAEVVRPRITIPLSLAIGTATVTLLYVLANVSYLVVLPLKGTPNAVDVMGRGIQFAAADRVATAAVSAVFGDAAIAIMAVLIMISTFGCNNGLILAGARVYYAMAKDGLFFRRAGTLNARSVPAWALICQGVWASLLCVSGSYGDLLDYVIFAVLLFYVLTIVGLFILRRKRPGDDRPYKAVGYPVVPGLYILIALGICVDLLIFKPSYTWPGVVIVLLGIPVYYAWARSLTRRPVRDG